MPEEFEPLAPGTVLFKRYRIERLIRKGGMGAAYEAQDRETGKKVALKELIDSFDGPEERESGVGNFLAEMQVLKSLHHPQIPRLLDHFVEKRGFFLILDFVDGKDLTAKLEARNREGLPEDETIRIGVHVCRVLDYLHSRKPVPVIHQDIKSSNILERKMDGRILVVDFGIAKAARPKEGMMIGTLGYAPPEQHMNRVVPASDIYALGATLHELSTGKRPDSEGFYFPYPGELRPDLSQGFCDVIVRALGFTPEERFESARVFEEALQSLLNDPVPSLEPDRFSDACASFSASILFPMLKEVREKYLNECQTQVFPEHLNHFSFVLGAQIPYSLIIQASEEKQVVEFYSKEGILSKVYLGEVSPADGESPEKTKLLVDQFLSIYDSAGGGAGGFIAR